MPERGFMNMVEFHIGSVKMEPCSLVLCGVMISPLSIPKWHSQFDHFARKGTLGLIHKALGPQSDHFAE